ncbi:DUF1697 domain-containing protein [Occallatibacter savannae]|uniref:DUF1697 domain-containing protein n=1 Tax=Occallatibacter savannae TaxID=1002691 RepID=UPI0013A57058|nr:DUF1697 domain-containing protein [Occallatibacter savannae]
MSTYVILLRAVNVGGNGKLSMADFRKILSALKFQNVETYIQSGNAVVDSDLPAAKVGASIAAALEKLTGAPVDVILRTHDQLDKLIRANPFPAEAADGARVHVAFLSAPAAPTARAALDAIVEKYPSRRDRYHLAGDHIYFHFPEGAGETKFTGKALDKAIGAVGTGRNWNTVLKLHAMSKRR